MADRYISVQALIENIVKIPDLRTLSTKTIGEAIAKTPTADVVEVKHGEWISEFGTFGRVICSVCKSQCLQETELDPYGVRKPTNVYVTSNYCPNCGAKMDGGII